MITYKYISLEDLKQNHSHDKGFVFNGGFPSSDESVQKLCDGLIAEKITSSFPEFVVKLDPTIYVFVYGRDFDLPKFLQRSDIVCRMFGFKIDSLFNFLST